MYLAGNTLPIQFSSEWFDVILFLSEDGDAGVRLCPLCAFHDLSRHTASQTYIIHYHCIAPDAGHLASSGRPTNNNKR